MLSRRLLARVGRVKGIREIGPFEDGLGLTITLDAIDFDSAA